MFIRTCVVIACICRQAPVVEDDAEYILQEIIYSTLLLVSFLLCVLCVPRRIYNRFFFFICFTLPGLLWWNQEAALRVLL